MSNLFPRHLQIGLAGRMTSLWIVSREALMASPASTIH